MFDVTIRRIKYNMCGIYTYYFCVYLDIKQNKNRSYKLKNINTRYIEHRA